jgi:hypothetical protein
MRSTAWRSEPPERAATGRRPPAATSSRSRRLSCRTDDPDPVSISSSPAWLALQRHREALTSLRLDAALGGDPARTRDWRFAAAGIEVDLSRNLATEQTWPLLLALAETAELPRWREQLFSGAAINDTEGRAAWHTALRGVAPESRVARSVDEERGRMLEFAQALRAGRLQGAGGKAIDTVISIGIGGSDLGPRLVTAALGEASGPVRLHFVSNIDPAELDAALAQAAPETTLIVAVSKSFTTQETLENARAALAWLQARAPGLDTRRHLAAVTSQPQRAMAFGADPGLVFTFADWVGGRYSLWSACGLPIAIAHGASAFRELLRGAAALDEHFASAPPERNLPLLLGLLGVWYVNFWGCRSRAVMPYAQRLRHLPAYLQQLEMESNGKRVRPCSRWPVDRHALPARDQGQPKEMLPVVDKPLIQYAVEEAVAAGITDLIFITGRNKRAIEDHFDKAYELECRAGGAGKHELLEARIRCILPEGVNCVYIRQPERSDSATRCCAPGRWWATSRSR